MGGISDVLEIEGVVEAFTTNALVQSIISESVNK
jgi:hypothetical protein